MEGLLKRNIYSPLFIIISLLSVNLQAGIVEVPSDGVQRLVIRGLDANVVVTSQPQAKSIRINGVDDILTPGLYIAEKKGSTLEVHLNEWSTKADWNAQLNLKKNHPSLEISGFPVATEIYLHEGQVQISRLSKEARVIVVKGKISSTDSSGPLEIFLHQGEVSVQNQTGRTKIDQYQGQTTIRNMQADLDLSAFNSNVSIEKFRGLLSLNTQNSPTKMLQSSGTLQLENGKGAILIQQFQGRVDGSTQEGPLNITLLADSETHLRSQSGRIQIQLPAASGAALNLASNEGDILIPEGLKISRAATEKSFRGRLRGDLQKAAVTVRSQEGSIIIK